MGECKSINPDVLSCDLVFELVIPSGFVATSQWHDVQKINLFYVNM